jgi:ABC-2 type transport system ATP-binding protein
VSTAVEIDNLSYARRHPWTWRRTPTLEPFSISIASGEAFGFLGHNGAGKTTTIKNILGLVTPTTGSITLFGIDNRDPSSRRPIGYVPENPYFYDHLRVGEAISLGAQLAGICGGQVKKVVGDTLERVGLSSRHKSPLRTLSKGLLQRVAIGHALVSSPRLLILDEPFSGLDPIGRHEMRTLFEEERRSGTTLFLASHILNDVEALCDRVSIMVKGKLRGVFSCDDLGQHPSHGYELAIGAALSSEDIAAVIDQPSAEFTCRRQRSLTVITITDEDQARKTLMRCLEKNLPIASFQQQHPTLEQLYLAIVDPSTARSEGRR